MARTKRTVSYKRCQKMGKSKAKLKCDEFLGDDENLTELEKCLLYAKKVVNHVFGKGGYEYSHRFYKAFAAFEKTSLPDGIVIKMIAQIEWHVYQIYFQSMLPDTVKGQKDAWKVFIYLASLCFQEHFEAESLDIPVHFDYFYLSGLAKKHDVLKPLGITMNLQSYATPDPILDCEELRADAISCVKYSDNAPLFFLFKGYTLVESGFPYKGANTGYSSTFKEFRQSIISALEVVSAKGVVPVDSSDEESVDLDSALSAFATLDSTEAEKDPAEAANSDESLDEAMRKLDESELAASDINIIAVVQPEIVQHEPDSDLLVCKLAEKQGGEIEIPPNDFPTSGNVGDLALSESESEVDCLSEIPTNRDDPLESDFSRNDKTCESADLQGDLSASTHSVASNPSASVSADLTNSNLTTAPPAEPTAKAILGEVNVVRQELLSPIPPLASCEPPYKKRRVHFESISPVVSVMSARSSLSRDFLQDLHVTAKRAQCPVSVGKTLKSLSISANTIMHILGKIGGLCRYLQEKFPESGSLVSVASRKWVGISDSYGTISALLVISEKLLDKFVSKCKTGDTSNIYVLVSSLVATHGWFRFFEAVSKAIMDQFSSLLAKFEKGIEATQFVFEWAWDEDLDSAAEAAATLPEILQGMNATIRVCMREPQETFSHDSLIKKLEKYFVDLAESMDL